MQVDVQDNSGQTMLLLAINAENCDLVRLLLEQNPNVNLTDKYGRSPLMNASLNRHFDVAKLLLQKKETNVDIQDNDGWSALMFACQQGHYKMVELLLKYNADPDLLNAEGESALSLALQQENVEVITLLEVYYNYYSY